MKSRSRFLFRSRRDEGALVGTRHALSLLMKSNAELDKKIKTWSVTDLVVMTLNNKGYSEQQIPRQARNEEYFFEWIFEKGVPFACTK